MLRSKLLSYEKDETCLLKVVTFKETSFIFNGLIKLAHYET